MNTQTYRTNAHQKTHQCAVEKYKRQRKGHSGLAAEDDEIIYLSEQAAIGVWLEIKVREGEITREEADEIWPKVRQDVKAFAEYFPIVKDAGIAAYIQADFGKSFGRVRTATYAGNTHIILKGRPGLRKILTGTKYRLDNAKIVSLGIGKAGLRNSVKQGGILSLVLVTTFNIIDYALNDKATISSFTAGMTVDLGIVAASTGIGFAAGMAVQGTIIASVALGPLVVAIGVTFVAGLALGWVAEKLELKRIITEKIDAGVAYVESTMESAKQAAREKVSDITEEVTEIIINAALDIIARKIRQGIRRYIGPQRWIHLQ